MYPFGEYPPYKKYYTLFYKDFQLFFLSIDKQIKKKRNALSNWQEKILSPSAIRSAYNFIQ